MSVEDAVRNSGRFHKEAGVDAFIRYAEDARNGKFPEDEHTYKMVKGELPKLTEMLEKK